MAEPTVTAPVEAPPTGPEATPAPAVPEQTTYDADTYGLFTKSHLAERHEGRFGNVIRESNSYHAAEEEGRFEPGVKELIDMARQNNMTPQTLYDFITTDQQAATQQQQQYDTPGQKPPTALTEERYNELRTQERAEDTAVRQAADADSKRADAFGTEGEDVTRMLRDEFKYTFTEDGLPDGSRATVAQQLFHSALNKVMKDDVPDWYSREERAEALRTIGSTPSSSAQRQKAKELFGQWVTEFKNDAVADFAKGQEGVPAATLGTGAGGSVTKDVKDMTAAEQAAELDRRVHARTGEHIDPAYDG